MPRKVALVTGASRGIGKSCAIYLARAGFDLVITARTLREGEAREHSPSVKSSDVSPLPGSLESTEAAIRAEGGAVTVLPADITDAADLGAAAATIVERFGGVDVLVNAARFIGGGHMDQLLDTPVDLLQKTIQGNVLAPVILAQRLLPGMIGRGGGTIINFTSASAFSDPLVPAGKGGWGACYALSKGAIHRLAGIIAVELGGQNIRCFNIDPGFTVTERIEQDMRGYGWAGIKGAPVEVSGAVTAWLATEADAAAFNGQTIIAQQLCDDRRLLPSWSGPAYFAARTRRDPIARQTDQFDAALKSRYDG